MDARKERGSSKNCLEIEWEIVRSRDEDKAMTETNAQSGDIGVVLEYPHRHHGVSGDFPFVEHEETGDEDAEDDEADYFCRAPGVGHTAEFESEEEHQSSAYYA